MGYLLIRSAQIWNDRAIARVNEAAERPLLREAHTRILPHLLEPGGIRSSEIARRLSISKQAVGQLVADMVAAGVVRLETDPDDARARRVVLTPHGFAAMKHGTGILLDIERELAKELGLEDMRVLRRLLGGLLRALSRDRSSEDAS